MSAPLLAHDEENVAVADSVSARKELNILTCSHAGVSRCVQVVVQWQGGNFAATLDGPRLLPKELVWKLIVIGCVIVLRIQLRPFSSSSISFQASKKPRT